MTIYKLYENNLFFSTLTLTQKRMGVKLLKQIVINYMDIEQYLIKKKSIFGHRLN